VTETVNPENELNLLTDIAVQSNNTDDSNIMNDRIEPLKEKTPDLKELHTDGGYGSEDNDRKFEELGITHIQTAVRGRKSKVDMTIEKTTEGEYDVCLQYGNIDKLWANPPLSNGKSGFIRVIRTNEGRRQPVFKKLGSNWSKSAQYFPVCYF